jgi:two-component system sensor histidine kinase RegB
MSDGISQPGPHGDAAVQATPSRVAHAVPPRMPGGRIRLRTLIYIRWIAVIGQLMALLAVHVGLDFAVPVFPAALAISASAALNLFAAIGHRGTVWLDDTRAGLYLGFDLVQLAILLGITGGLNNPFVVLLLAPVVVSAATLSRWVTALLGLAAILAVSVLGLWSLPLPWRETGFVLPDVYRIGIWFALCLSICFLGLYVSSLAAEARQMADALSATQMALAREQRLSALGGLAAAAAHELGSPLGTIAVVAREIERELPRDLPPDSPLRADVQLLRDETGRCRDILAELAQRPDEDAQVSSGNPYNRIPVHTLVETAAAPFLRERIDFQVVLNPPEDPGDALAEEPVVPRLPEAVHGLGTLIQNAIQFAQGRVEAEIGWTERTLTLRLTDDGPGFDDAVLGALGDPYLSTGGRGRPGAAQGEKHMGLGIFIAQTLLERTGASLSFANRAAPSRGGGRGTGGWAAAARTTGAEVVVTWDRNHFEKATGV